ncbi:hypothetical protein F5Y16DRAFT_383679 [Xylariaceae sp. FL0255]|nr:hypothetical protein F5Y16DRAFT_383679 [Xylariaceae sp. FL0255]
MSASGPSTSPNGGVDPLELIDLSEYDTMQYQQSPTVSPTTTQKAQFARATPTITTSALMPSGQILSGPSHQYDQYKQQTPFVPGALASTLAINENNVHITGYDLEYINPGEELFDFNSVPSQTSMTSPDMDMDFDSAADATFFYGARGHIDTRSPSIAAPPSNVGKMYPGMHQQAALAKAQAQERQQQEIIAAQQQAQRRPQFQQRPQNKQVRSKAPLPADPIIEQKITQLLESMRSKVASSDASENSPVMHISRPKKEEDDMDEDERLLASEEGKKLSSKERRQLRNKVSARAFRSRRKEYIGQLESEIATKVTENSTLRAENRALQDENRRLTDLTRMLLSSPSFSNFLDHLSANPAAIPQSQPQMEQRQPESQQAPKDISPYHAANQGQHQQIGMVMIPEQTMDFSMLNLNSDAYHYQQPRVFAVCEMPEPPTIDVEVLKGKTSNSVGESHANSDKTNAPVLELPIPVAEKPQAPKMPTEESKPAEKSVVDLDSDIFDEDVSAARSSPVELNTDVLSTVEIFGGVEPEKAFARYELTDAYEEAEAAELALRRVERLASSLEATITRLELMGLADW